MRLQAFHAAGKCPRGVLLQQVQRARDTSTMRSSVPQIGPTRTWVASTSLLWELAAVASVLPPNTGRSLASGSGDTASSGCAIAGTLVGVTGAAISAPVRSHPTLSYWRAFASLPTRRRCLLEGSEVVVLPLGTGAHEHLAP